VKIKNENCLIFKGTEERIGYHAYKLASETRPLTMVNKN
jgi:hypothetical protein